MSGSLALMRCALQPASIAVETEPVAVTSSSTTPTQQQQTKPAKDTFVWTKAWYPVAALDSFVDSSKSPTNVSCDQASRSLGTRAAGCVFSWDSIPNERWVCR